MCCTVEVAFDLRKRGQTTLCQRDVESIAYDCRCEALYTLHEFEGRGRVVERNHRVVVAEFEGFEGATQFLSKIAKMRYAYIECIYTSGCPYRIVYASKRYLKLLTKEEVKEYRKRERETEENRIVTSIISGKI